jgi:hypothetical protein
MALYTRMVHLREEELIESARLRSVIRQQARSVQLRDVVLTEYIGIS